VDVRPVRRQLELAWTDLDAGQLPDHRIAAEVPSLLRRRLQGGVSGRLWPLSHHRRGGERAGVASDTDLPARREWRTPGIRREPAAPGRSPFPRSRVIP